MKQSAKIIFAFVLVFVLCSSAFAALPSITMLSTQTCPACKQMSKVLEKIASDYGNKIKTNHVYVDDKKNRDIAMKYEVRYVPMLIFKDARGKEIAREVGYKSLEEVLAIFRKAGVKI